MELFFTKKNTIFVFITIVGLIISGVAFSTITNAKLTKIQNANPYLTAKNELNISDFQIAGLTLDNTIADVLKIHGSPLKITSSKNKDRISYDYTGFTVIFDTQTKETVNIIVKQEKIPTYRGVCVNDDDRKVISHYGKIEKYEGKYLVYISHIGLDTEYGIEFTVVDKKVKSIKMFFAVD